MGAPNCRFFRKSRLLKPEEYRRVFQGRCKSADGTFAILAKQNDLGHARLGLAISSKAVRGAVARNRIKRVIRESFRQRQAWLRGLDLVVTARAGIAQKTNNELRVVLEKHWRTLIRCKKS